MIQQKEWKKFDLEYVDGYEPIINDPGIVDLVISACRKNMGEDSVKIGEYDEGSDDFSYYMNATGTSGAYFFLLSGHEREECFVNHHPRFTWKEEAMKIGVESYLSVLMEYLNQKLQFSSCVTYGKKRYTARLLVLVVAFAE